MQIHRRCLEIPEEYYCIVKLCEQLSNKSINQNESLKEKPLRINTGCKCVIIYTLL